MEDTEIEKRFVDHHRRFTDKLRDCKRDVDEVLAINTQSIMTIQDDIAEMKEILLAWNNMKGFASGMRFFSTVIKIITPIILLIGGLYYFIKTGKYPE